MGFSLNVLFGGLLHYVVNRRNDEQVACKLCIVLPFAPDHMAQIAVQKGSLGNGDDSIDFAGKRVVFQFTKNQAEDAADFDFEGPVIGGSHKGAVPFERILGTSADRSRKIVGPEPPAAVRAQILIGKEGVFSSVASSSPPEIGIPGTLMGGGDFSALPMAELVSMRLEGLDAAKIVILPLDNSLDSEAVYSIVPNDQGEAELLVSHDCATDGMLHVGDDDKDFRFHYTLLDQLPAGIHMDDMPVPRINKFSKKSRAFRLFKKGTPFSYKPNGCNCAGSRGVARSFDLDKFMTV